MRTLFRDGQFQKCHWYEIREMDRNVVHAIWEWRYWYILWQTYRWRGEWWGLEHGWYGVREEMGYFSEGRWRRPWEKPFEFSLLPPDECKPPWNTPDRFSRFTH